MTENAYKLYLLRTNAASLLIASEERFQRITPIYTLLYTKADAPLNGILIDKSNLNRLSAQDTEWLCGCNIILASEEGAKDREQKEKGMNEFLIEFDKNLAAEQKKLKEGAGEDV